MTPYLVYMVGGIGGRKWHHLAHHQLTSQQNPRISPPNTAKKMIEALSSGLMVSSGIRDVVIV